MGKKLQYLAGALAPSDVAGAYHAARADKGQGTDEYMKTVGAVGAGAAKGRRIGAAGGALAGALNGLGMGHDVPNYKNLSKKQKLAAHAMMATGGALAGGLVGGALGHFIGGAKGGGERNVSYHEALNARRGR